MDAFDNFLTGTITLFSDPIGILIFFGGVIGGMLFGAIPGVSMLTLAAILLPFTAHLSPEHGIMLFSVIYCTGVYGGAITAILFNIPGAPENAPTAFDGYPMTQKGQAGKAVGAAVMCSALGGSISCIIMMLATAPIADWAISAFGRRQNLLERLAVNSDWIDGRGGWTRPGGWHRTLRFRNAIPAGRDSLYSDDPRFLRGVGNFRAGGKESQGFLHRAQIKRGFSEFKRTHRA
jgi:hypothetical protein